MGLIVAMWSPLHGRGTTANCIAAATQFSYKYNAKVYMLHTHYSRSTMETAFLSGKEEEDLMTFSDLGIDSIERALKTGLLQKEDFKSYCNKINDNLYMLSGSKKSRYSLFDKSIGETFASIINFAKESNDITFIDVESAFTKEIAFRVIDLADIVVVNLDQTNYLCEEYFSKDNKHRIDKEKEMIVIARYDWESKYSKKYIDKAFKQDVFVIPQLTEYLDAMNNHRVNSFFKANYELEDELFFDEINRLNERIVEKAREKNIIFEKKEIVPTDSKKQKFKIFNRR